MQSVLILKKLLEHKSHKTIILKKDTNNSVVKEQKVLVISKYATTINEGFETRTCELAYNIALKGYEVTIMTSDSNHLAVFQVLQNL